jgi:hypothetical protein
MTLPQPCTSTASWWRPPRRSASCATSTPRTACLTKRRNSAWNSPASSRPTSMRWRSPSRRSAFSGRRAGITPNATGTRPTGPWTPSSTATAAIRRYRKRIEWCLGNWASTLQGPRSCRSSTTLPTPPVAYHCSGFKEKTAILGIDGKGEYATTFFGYGENGRIHKIKEFYDPIPWAASTARSPNTSASRCSTANTRSWAWRPTAIRALRPSRVWRSSSTANWSSIPTTPTSSVCAATRKRARATTSRPS